MTHRILFICFCLAVLFSSTLRAAEEKPDWPQFRGPTGQGVSTATGVPIEWGPNKNVVWKAEIPGKGWSSPVYVGGRLYLTTAIERGGRTSLYALCLDAETGKPVWDVEVFRPDFAAAKAIQQKNSLASPTPIVSGDRLYVHFGHMGTAALDLGGKIIWTQTGLKYPPVHGNGGSPVLVDDLLVFNCDGGSNPFIVALDAKTGQVRWKTPRNTKASRPFSFSTPLAIKVGEATQIVSPASGFVGGYDPATGRELWRVRYGEGYSVVPRPVFADGLVFVSSGFDAAVLYAIDPQGAAGDATASHVAWKSNKGAPHTPSLLADGDDLYSVSDEGVVTGADARTGTPHWTHRLPGNFSASPVLAEGRVYCQSEEGVGYVLKAGKTFQSLAENDLGERSLASYAVTDRALFIRTDRHLWKIGGTP